MELENNKKIIDYISGKSVNGNKEEIEAVQPMAKQLVEEFEYSKNVIQTHPQFRVRKSPSDESESYPIDIAVFENENKSAENIRMIVECKAPDITSGRTQLEKYMGLTSAKIGVWFNGTDTLILKKVISKNSFYYQELPYIPASNQDIEEDSKLYKKDLKPNADLKSILNRIRGYLVSREEGITHDAKLAEEIINLILCKIYDEKETDIDVPLQFSVSLTDTDKAVQKKVHEIFDNVKKNYPDIFSKNDDMKLSAKSLAYCVSQLQKYSIIQSSRDVIGDAFEVFIGPTLRGAKGQYFTPRNVTNFVVSALDPKVNKKIIDPSCGSGGFLISALDHVWNKLVEDKVKKGWDDALLSQKKMDVASKYFFGLDKDRFLTKVTKAYMAIMGDGKGGIFCEDTLKANEAYSTKTQDRMDPFKFDYIFANPPYGDEIKVEERETLKLYDLGHKHKDLVKTEKIAEARRPQILFIEKIINLLENDGKAGIVLPETLFSNPSDRYIINYILNNTTVLGMVSLPAETFKPSADVKTCILIIKKEKPLNDYNIFMGICRNIGHDMRAKSTGKDDLPQILNNWKVFQEKNNIKKSDESELGFVIKYSDIKNFILTPHTYWYKKSDELVLNKSVSLGELIDKKIINIKKGKAVKASQYVSDGIPFVRTSDISNYEVSRQTSKYISINDYQNVKKDYDIKTKDILFVTRGRTSTDLSNGLIGETAFILAHQTQITIQGAVSRIRLVDTNNSYNITPENLIYLLSESHVKAQIKVACGTEGALTGLNENTLRDIRINLFDAQKMLNISETMIEIFHHKNEINTLINSLNTKDDSAF